jgi:hypothetical protein
MLPSNVFFGLSTAVLAAKTGNVHPFRINLAEGIPHLEALVKNTRLPEKPLYPGAGIEFGVQLDFLRDLQTQWVDGFNWTAQEAELNQ